MRKSKYKYKVYNGKAIKEMFENTRMIFLLILFAVGIIIGAKVINSENVILQEQIKNLLNSFTMKRAGQGVINNFIESLFSVSIFNLVSVFLAFSLIGYPLLIWLPCIKGIGIGAIAGYLYSVYQLTGLGYCILTIFPGAIVSTVALIIACNDSCDYSKNAFMKALRGRGQYEKDETKIYLIRQAIMIGVCIVSSIIDSVFSLAFSRFFEI